MPCDPGIATQDEQVFDQMAQVKVRWKIPGTQSYYPSDRPMLWPSEEYMRSNDAIIYYVWDGEMDEDQQRPWL